MIIARKMCYNQEKDKIMDILNKNGINARFSFKDDIYILKENESIIGVSKVVFNSISSAILDYLVIDKSKRGEDLGDGLLRAVLNYCMSKGITIVYFSQFNNYLVNKGFEQVDNGILKCDLNKFFSKGCSHQGRWYCGI